MEIRHRSPTRQTTSTPSSPRDYRTANPIYSNCSTTSPMRLDPAGFRSYIRIPEELVLFLGWRRWWRWLDDVRGFRRHAFYTLCWVRFCIVDHGRYFFGGGGGGGGGLTAVGGFGVTPSCTLIFLTNFIRGGGCWFVMVLLRMFTDIICRWGKLGTLLNCWKNFYSRRIWEEVGRRSDVDPHYTNDSNTFITKGLQNRQFNLFQ